MKRAIFFFVVMAALGMSSCCRYRGPMYWDREETIPFDLEKKDLKKGERCANGLTAHAPMIR